MIDITTLVIAFIAAGIAALAGWPWLKGVIESREWERFLGIVTVAVKAAEQLGIATKAKGEIMDKLTWAKGRVRELLAKYKITYDETIVETAIEAKVLELFPHK